MKVPMLDRGDAILFDAPAYIEQEDGVEYTIVSASNGTQPLFPRSIVSGKIPLKKGEDVKWLAKDGNQKRSGRWTISGFVFGQLSTVEELSVSDRARNKDLSSIVVPAPAGMFNPVPVRRSLGEGGRVARGDGEANSNSSSTTLRASAIVTSRKATFVEPCFSRDHPVRGAYHLGKRV
jgi:hypothetical protein